MNGLIDYKKVYESALKLKGVTLERYLDNTSKHGGQNKDEG